MGVRRFEDLVAWQLAIAAKRAVYALVDRTTAKHDVRFRDQIEDSAASAPSAISEGFGRFYHPEFAYLLGVAKSSLNETKNHLIDGVDRQHWSPRDCADVIALVDRAIGATTNLLKHVNSTDAPGPPRRQRPRR